MSTAEKKQGLGKVFMNGILDENPTFRLVLGTCPTLATTTSATNGFGMGLSVTFVLLCSNIVISLLRKFIPDKVRIPSFIVVIAAFVTILKLLLQAYVPSLYSSLGIFLPLIVVNCIILARAEAFASKHPVVDSAVDGLGMGLGFTIALTLIGAIREILGSGSIFGINIFGASFEPMLILVLASGGFLSYGILLGIINAITNHSRKAKLEKGEN
ncbi:MAG: electron transport complex subunit E [Clostridia bacterium]|nr:electron transport complex subunit E [Clostridia bacterium]